MKELILSAVAYALFVVAAMTIIAMCGCASMGLFQMSEQWCNQHPEASAQRCAGR